MEGEVGVWQPAKSAPSSTGQRRESPTPLPTSSLQPAETHVCHEIDPLAAVPASNGPPPAWSRASLECPGAESRQSLTPTSTRDGPSAGMSRLRSMLDQSSDHRLHATVQCYRRGIGHYDDDMQRAEAEATWAFCLHKVSSRILLLPRPAPPPSPSASGVPDNLDQVGYRVSHT